MAQAGSDDMARLARIAAAVGRSAHVRNPGWPTLWLFTDPERTKDLLGAVARLPRGAGVVLRTFGRPEVAALAGELRQLTLARHITLLIGADAELAARCDADGLHLPERMAGALPRLRAQRPGWRFTTAAHSAVALRRAAKLGVGAAFLSPVLPSVSASAGPALGALKVSALTRSVSVPVYGLGGVDASTAQLLAHSGLAGLAGVGFAQGAAKP